MYILRMRVRVAGSYKIARVSQLDHGGKAILYHMMQQKEIFALALIAAFPVLSNGELCERI